MSGNGGNGARARESVWDYPRPPRIVRADRRVRIEHGGETIADSAHALRVLETASPPTIYVPAADVRGPSAATSLGEGSLAGWAIRCYGW